MFPTIDLNASDRFWGPTGSIPTLDNDPDLEFTVSVLKADKTIDMKEIYSKYKPAEGNKGFRTVGEVDFKQQHNNRRRFTNQRNNNRRNYRGYKRLQQNPDLLEPTVTIEEGWSEEINFSIPTLKKIRKGYTVESDTLATFGSLNAYDRRIANSNPSVPQDQFFATSTASEDSIMRQLAKEHDCDIAITETVCSRLATLTRAYFGFDIVFRWIDGCLFIDKRNDKFDRVYVDETAGDLAFPDKSPNQPFELTEEMTRVKHGVKTVVAPENPVYEEEPHPELVSHGQTLYRIFNVKDKEGDKTYRILIRCSIDCMRKTTSKEHTVKVCTLLEWNKVRTNWKRAFSIDSKREGAKGIAFGENRVTVAQWCIEALLTELTMLSVGFISRENSSNNNKHKVLLFEDFQTAAFCRRFAINHDRLWTDFFALVEPIMSLERPDENSCFILIKPPTKGTANLWMNPSGEFATEE
ncbi:hypothetical protein PCE1_002076 [Barthelona sp. PCE]